jgi:hypothetical protein
LLWRVVAEVALVMVEAVVPVGCCMAHKRLTQAHHMQLLLVQVELVVRHQVPLV